MKLVRSFYLIFLFIGGLFAAPCFAASSDNQSDSQSGQHASVGKLNGSDVSVRTVIYSSNGLPADIYEDNSKPSTSAKPAMLMIHGGGWGSGSRREFTGLAKQVAKQGFVPILIDYRLTSTGIRWPSQARDVETAVWWIRENAASLHIDPNRIVALGASAGAHLAAWLATTDHRNQNGTSSRVNLLIGLWGPWDLAAPNLRNDTRGMVNALVGKTNAQEASPFYFIDNKTPPTLLIHGTKDELVRPDQSVRACDALRAASVECDLLLLEGEGHGFSKAQNSELFIKRMSAFVSKHFNRKEM